MKNKSNLYNTAESYRRLGLSIIPMNHQGKKPMVSWEKYQKKKPNKSEIVEWFGNGESNNIAIVCGEVSGNLVVLDFDSHKEYKVFTNNWLKLRGKHPKEETWVVKTGRGYHIYLRTTVPLGTYNHPNMEIKGEGGCVVAPPSVHPNGKTYKFVNPEITEILEVESLEDMGIELPDKSNEIINKGSDWVTPLLEGVEDGNRDNACTKLAGYFKSQGLLEDVTCVLLKIWGEERCTPIFPEKEVEKCVKSVYKYPDNSIEDYSSESTLVWANDLVMLEGEKIEPLWGNILFPESIHLFSGDTGVGKTTFLYNLAIEGATGESFLDIPFSRPLRVLYLDYETSNPLKILKLNRITSGDRPEYLAFDSIDFTSNKNLDTLIKITQENGFNLVIVDTINEAFRTQKEDDNAEANRQMYMCQ